MEQDEAADVALRLPDVGPPLLARWRTHLARTAPWVRIDDGPAAVVVTVPGRVPPPRWPWLPQLLAAFERPGVAAAVPVLLHDDLTIAGPVLAGHPVSTAERLDGVGLPSRPAGPIAERTGQPGQAGPVVLAAAAWLPVPAGPAVPDGPEWEHLGREAVTPAAGGLRWSIDIAAPAAPRGRLWGDWHFARSLAAALERLGQVVEIDHPETRGRPGLAELAEVDVTLTLRGLERVVPPAGPVRLMWVISHPDDVDDAEIARYDRVFAAGTAWAREHGVAPLPQCTEFTPAPVSERHDDVLFVGNARGGTRPAVAAAVAAGRPVTVVGAHWAQPGAEVVAESLPNRELPARYAAAGVVLCDHHEDMRVRGFVSNRVFDVLAAGGRLLTDDVAGLGEALGPELAAAVQVWRSPDDVGRLAVPPFAGWPDDAARSRLARQVVAQHSFDARAVTLLDAARALLGS